MRARPDDRLTARQPPPRAEPARGAHRARARRARADRRRTLQPGDRRPATPEPENRRDPHPPDLPKARPGRGPRLTSPRARSARLPALLREKPGLSLSTGGPPSGLALAPTRACPDVSPLVAS